MFLGFLSPLSSLYPSIFLPWTSFVPAIFLFLSFVMCLLRVETAGAHACDIPGTVKLSVKRHKPTTNPSFSEIGGVQVLVRLKDFNHYQYGHFNIKQDLRVLAWYLWKAVQRASRAHKHAEVQQGIWKDSSDFWKEPYRKKFTYWLLTIRWRYCQALKILNRINKNWLKS